MDRSIAEARLHDIFGIDHFYDEQWNAISHIMNGDRILMNEPIAIDTPIILQEQDSVLSIDEKIKDILSYGAKTSQEIVKILKLDWKDPNMKTYLRSLSFVSEYKETNRKVYFS